MTNVGVLGLGIMGSAMSGHLLARGIPVYGYDPIPGQVATFTAAGGHGADSVGDVVRQVDLLVTSLPTASAAESVCHEVAAAASAGLTVVETSTLPMTVKVQCRELLAEAGVILLDCPLSGTGAQALERDVVVFGSGDQVAFETARPVLEAFSRSVRYLGQFGHGSTMKYVANLLVSVHNVATAEAFALGERAGLDPHQIYETIRDGAGNSVIFEKRGRLMAERSYLPATARVTMFIKDIGVISDYAQELNLPTPMLDATKELYRRAVDSGLGDSDAAALLSLMSTDTLHPATTDNGSTR